MQVDYLDICSYPMALDLQRRSQISKLLIFRPVPVITLGLRATRENDVFFSGSVPVLRVDRGGEATYHGPGQLLFFPVIHLPTLGFGVKEWTEFLMNVTVRFLNLKGVTAFLDKTRPGIYTNNGKIASLGLKIRHGYNSHGIALNVAGDLSPFQSIKACGVAASRMDQLNHWFDVTSFQTLAEEWSRIFRSELEVRAAFVPSNFSVNRPEILESMQYDL